LAWLRRQRQQVVVEPQPFVLVADFEVVQRAFGLAGQRIPIRALRLRVGAFVPTLSHAERRNYFRHAGYVSI
jgi:hypothetical protein